MGKPGQQHLFQVMEEKPALLDFLDQEAIPLVAVVVESQQNGLVLVGAEELLLHAAEVVDDAGGAV